MGVLGEARPECLICPPPDKGRPMPARKPSPITLAGSAGEPKPRRSKEEIAAERAAKAQARVARIEAMRAACLTECKVPCPLNCENRCHKRKVAKLVSRAKRERLKAAARRMSGLTEQDIAAPKSAATEGEIKAASAARLEAKKEAHRRGQEEAAKAAQKAQRRGKKAVNYSELGKAIEKPNEHRLRHADGFHGIDREYAMGVMVTAKGPAEFEVVTERVRLRDTPFDKIIARKVLTKDQDMNQSFQVAGYAYLRDCEAAGMLSMASVDPAGASGKSVPDGRMMRSDAQVEAFKFVLDVRSRFTADEHKVVDAVLLHRATIVEAGREISGRRDDQVAAGIGVYVMQSAMQVLAKAYGVMPRTIRPPASRNVSKRDMHLALASGLSIDDASMVSRIIDDSMANQT